MIQGQGGIPTFFVRKDEKGILKCSNKKRLHRK